ncbi:MAG TPA: anthranilate synthase component I family protein [Nitrospiraceae bacterium]|nr:anthranilate synthase component I family protein [Nitrospiraceae bacterium]
MLSIPAPTEDPYELYCRLAIPGYPSFLLESGKGSDTVARYSFMGCGPYLVLSGKEHTYELKTRTGITVHTGSPWTALRDRLRASHYPHPEGLPPFFGGAIVFLSYDLVRQFEQLPSLALDDLRLPDLQCLFIDQVAALDHHTRTLHLMFTPPLQRFEEETREKLYREGCDRLAEWEAKLTVPNQQDDLSSLIGRPGIQPGQSQDSYMERVRQCQEFISAGDIYQANLSHRFAVRWNDSRLSSDCQVARALYRRLKAVNPSPFSALLQLDRFSLVGCSPERLIRLAGRYVDTRPIAGTRRRGTNAADDRRLAEELLTNTKERAEHLMLVDLERNDLGRVCRYGSVRTHDLMTIERYSHVNHIVSNVSGELRDGVDGLDLIEAVFPGGTITGVPKIRCMEIIEQLEPVRRGPYTGSLGYMSWSGDLDLNIIIRTLVMTDSCSYLQVGAGIVADSDPLREYEETLLKAQAVMKALGLT